VAEFEIRGVIGEGGFSIVYLAWDHSLHRLVALKEYIPGAFATRDGALRVAARSQRHREMFEVGLKSFVGEARLLAGFDHPSLVKVHRFWEELGTAFMVMPWYQGPTLKKALASGGTPPSQAWLSELLRPLTEALSVLHALHCYHRDIAPDNIILAGDARVPVLLDFGAARKVVESMTQDLTTILKVGYAPLEQYGEIPGMRQGPWTDVYALAAVVHYAIRGSTPPPAVGRAVDDRYESLAGSGLKGYSDAFLTAIDKALAVHPQDRTQSIEEFRAQIGLGQRARDVPRSPGSTSAQNPAMGAGAEEQRTSSALAPRFLVPALGLVAAALAIGGWTFWSGNVDGDTNSSPALASPPASNATSDQGHATPTTQGPDVGEARKRLTLDSSQRLAVVTTDLRDLAKTENRDISPLLSVLSERQSSAQAAASAGNLDEAIAASAEGATLAERELKKMIDDLVRRYGDLADDATAAKQLEIAQLARDRAKKVGAIGAKYRQVP
jgi:serine/threonine protein kinase